MKKKIIRLALLVVPVLLVVSIGLAAGGQKAPPSDVETIPWVVITPGGCGASTNYRSCETIEPAAGIGKSTNYYLITGFWAAFGGGTCCIGIRGDVNYDMKLNVSDLTYLVSYLFKGGPAPPCVEEGDVNGDGKINVSDLTYLVSYLFKGGPAPLPCP